MASSWSSSPDYAGIGARAAAFAIDAMVLVVVCAPLMVVASRLVPLIVVPVAILGFWRYCGATPGMLSLGMKIVDASSGAAPASARLALRFAAALALAPLGFLWIAVDRRKQGWHDKIARTVVINSEDS